MSTQRQLKTPAVPVPPPITEGPTQEEVAALRAAVERGAYGDNPSRRRFALNLLGAYATNTLTFKMRPWIGRLVKELNRPASAALPSMQGVVSLLQRAGACGLKHPKLWLRLPNGARVRISVAGEKSNHPGDLQLTNGERYGSPDNRYYGHISTAGELVIGRDGFDVQQSLVDLLKRLASEPAKVAAEFGHLTGHCCFCELPLSDERSVHVGYGETCAEHFGLPWGEAPKSRKKRAAAR